MKHEVEMKFATFITDVKPEKKIQIPREVADKLRIETGDRVEISLKKIKSRKLDIILSENPLYRLLNITEPESAGPENKT